MTRLRRWVVARGPGLALAGVAVFWVGAIVAAIAYTGPDGEPYDPLHHTVSALGERGVSELASLFDIALVSSGLLITLYMAGIAWRSDSLSGRGFGTLGIVTGASMTLVGLFPVDDLTRHLLAAGLAFLSLLVLGSWFAAWVLRGGSPYPAWLGVLAIGVVAADIAFLALPGIAQPQSRFEMDLEALTPRPDIRLVSLLEWVAVSLSLTWIALVAWHDRSNTQGDDT